MKRWLVLLTVIVMAVGITCTAQAALTDTFTITITVNYIGINLRDNGDTTDYTTWAIGQVATSTASTMTQAQGIKLVNTSNTTLFIRSYATNTLSWTLAAAIGADTYKLEAKSFDASQASPDMTGAVDITATASQGNVIKSSLAAGTNQWIYYRLTAPSSVTSPNANAITVTVEATLS